MTPRRLLLGAFFLSGAAGLAYEGIWSRYLALVLGHSAYAQVLVIAVYLGGMAVGALVVARLGPRIRRPLLGYAWAEGALAVAGLAFHAVFVAASDALFSTWLPALSSPGLALGLRWGLAAVLVLPQAMLLGATFPLLAAGLLRARPHREGRTVAELYLANTAGGAIGILIAGFVLVPRLGTAGALWVAAAANAVAAVVALTVRPAAATVTPAPSAPVPEARPEPWLLRLFMVVAFFTAVASFGYEIAWIRMLSLVLGSATHAFEIMLSAFILGLALGSWGVRRRVEREGSMLPLLAGLQFFMGLFALATLPVYLLTFGVGADLVGALRSPDSDYALYHVGRYGLALGVMLPSTVLAGATLPVLTTAAMRAGMGESAVGRVYGVNTAGSLVGVGLAGLVLLPAWGLRGLLIGAAALDMALAVLVLLARPRSEPRRWAMAALAGAAIAVLVASRVPLEPLLLTSGAFRTGSLPAAGEREAVFYRDGRTATVGVHRLPGTALVLTTNGKPDASVPLDWLEPIDPAAQAVPLVSQDAATQTLLPLLGLAHAPGARRALVIGHGSGMSGHTLLRASGLERVRTVEIEPAIVEASRTFLPANRRVFENARHEFVLDDGRAHLATGSDRYDLIVSVPSNPWVSGVSSLFTREFYALARERLAEGGVLVQWFQLYEITDDLVLSVLAALHESFPDWRAYLIGDADLAVVAGASGPLAVADASVLAHGAVPPDELARIPPFEPGHLDDLLLFTRSDLEPLLARRETPANSDFHPYLDAGAERARLEAASAEGVLGWASDRFSVVRAVSGRAKPRRTYDPPPVWGLVPIRDGERAAWLGERADPLDAPYLVWESPARDLRAFEAGLDRDEPPPDWHGWLATMHRLEADLHRGTALWADTAFYQRVERFAKINDAPSEVRAVIALQRAAAEGDWPGAAAALDELGGPDGVGDLPFDRRWVRDVAVVALVRVGRREEARRWLAEWAGSGPTPPDLGVRLLRALLD